MIRGDLLTKLTPKVTDVAFNFRHRLEQMLLGHLSLVLLFDSQLRRLIQRLFQRVAQCRQLSLASKGCCSLPKDLSLRMTLPNKL